MKVHASRLDVRFDPAGAFSRTYGKSSTAFWLDSSSVGASSFSYMGDAQGPNSAVVRFDMLDGAVTVERRGPAQREVCDIFSYLQRELAGRAVDTADCPFDFACGYVGYLGYELKGILQGARAARAPTPDALWIFADRLIAFDHRKGETWILCLDESAGLSLENETWVRSVRRALQDLAVTGAVATRKRPGRCTLEGLRWRHGPDEYRRLIGRALRAIREGESYEVCLTNQVVARCTVDPLSAYETLRRVNPAPYGAFFRSGELAVLCSSPELFLRIDVSGLVTSKPIKGTAPRDPEAALDERNATELAASVKNRAENLMIVDLLRNDLNRVCAVGSVHVPEMFAIETYSTVHQLVSTVRGTLRQEMGIADCVRAAFPGGSMTGAPKVRTMAIIDDLEGGPRGVYSGSLGYLSLKGSATLNIVIRTMVLNGTRLTIGTGGAIVALSDPNEEFEEIVLKVRALLGALRQSGVDMRWEDLLAEPSGQTMTE